MHTTKIDLIRKGWRYHAAEAQGGFAVCVEGLHKWFDFPKGTKRVTLNVVTNPPWMWDWDNKSTYVVKVWRVLDRYDSIDNFIMYWNKDNDVVSFDDSFSLSEYLEALAEVHDTDTMYVWLEY